MGQLSLESFSGSNNLGAIIQGAIILGGNYAGWGAIVLLDNYPRTVFHILMSKKKGIAGRWGWTTKILC